MLFSRLWCLAGLIAPWLSLVATPLAFAQITPDATLGAEGSLVSPGVAVRGGVADLIEGGAVRGGNLFHSFLEFNVDAGQRVYFANPAGIESILSRITGGNPSAIFGTLGVDGAADLFLLNPNGIIFGENAALDIEGSFYASTAEAIPLGNGVYSATAPEQSSLLTVNPSALFSSYLSDASGDIENRGQLAAGENLTLAADRLDLQGQVAAGGNLTLLGNVVQIRDTVAVPFVGFAGGDLLVQGNEGVDIVALSHPESGLYSYGDMVLRSANPVLGDAHFWAGGSLQFERPDGTLGDLFSPTDPILFADGDVRFGNATATSLHILAGGSVTSTGTITITGVGPQATTINPTTEPTLANVTLSDGMPFVIDGSARPTLDIRAGIDWNQLGGSRGNSAVGLTAPPSIFGAEATSGDITLNRVQMNAPDGLVFLSNQFAPNIALPSSNIQVASLRLDDTAGGFVGNSGSVLLDARGNIDVTDRIVASASSGNVGSITVMAGNTVALDGSNFSANLLAGSGVGGDIRITATNVELTNGAQLSVSTLGNGDAGNVVIQAGDRVVFDGGSAGSIVGAEATGAGGNVEIAANSLEVLNGAVLSASTGGTGDAGNVVIQVGDRVVFDNGTAFSSVGAGATGAGGNVAIAANSLEVLNGAQLVANTLGNGDAGNVVIQASDAVVFDGTSADGQFRSVAGSIVGAEATGAGGNVEIAANSLEVLNGALLSASTLGTGDAGNVVIQASDAVVFDNGDAFSSVGAGATGVGGNVEINANSLEVLNGARLSASTLGNGDGGNVQITAGDRVVFDGGAAGSIVGAEATGAGGNVEIAANSLEVLNGAQLTASTGGTGDAGNVVIQASDAVVFDNGDALSAVEAGATGAGGNVEIAANSLEVLNGAQLTASTFGDGDAGNVVIQASDAVVFDGTSADGQFRSVAGSVVGAEATGAGGNVEIAANSLEVLNGALLSASTLGNGDAGNVVIQASDAVVFDGTSADGQFSSAAGTIVGAGATGAGGNVEINANSLEVLNGALLSASTLGNGDAGNVVINVDRQMRVTNGTISSFALETSGGRIDIRAGNLILKENSNILTLVGSGEGSGGNITIIADFVIALDDSDILAFSADGRGGNIDLSRTTFFGQNANIGSGNLTREELLALDGNDRVDINASGGVEPGQITVGDSSFIENSLTSLADTITDTAALTAGSCIARTDESLGSFTVTGSGGLPQRPGDSTISSYPTGTVRTGAEATATLQEPDGVYQLPDGRLVLSRACE